MYTLIGLFGGAFDPVHLGHIYVARALLARLSFSSIRFIPCHHPSHRAPLLASPIDRLTMLRRALEKDARLIVDSQEIDRGGVSYTIDTLEALSQETTDNAYALILSSEAFALFDTWKAWRNILTLSHLVIVNRSGHAFPPPDTSAELMACIKDHKTSCAEDLLHAQAGKLLYCPIDAIPTVSATAIRHALSTDINTLPTLPLPQAVKGYIAEAGLYTG